MLIRINSGSLKGKSFTSPNSKLTRISTSYSRKVIFDTLAPYIENATILDLFAGSGSLGIEALSRGAKKTYFIEKNKKISSLLNKNLSTLNIKHLSVVIPCDAFKIIHQWQYETIDIVFLDPPYSIPTIQFIHLLESLSNNKMLNSPSIICIEIFSKNLEIFKASIPENLSIWKEKIKGSTTLLFIHHL